MRRVCVFGAGAIGGHLAARLAAGGAELSVVARGATLEALRARGLRVETPDGVLTAEVAASADPRELGPQDAVVVAVKAPSLGSVAEAIGPLLGPDTPVAFVMNGIPWWYFHAHGGELDGRRLPRVDPGDRVRDAVGTGRAIGGVVYSSCTVTEPGVVHVETRRSRLELGEPDGIRSGRVEALAGLLRGEGMQVEVTERIRDRIWAKLLLNIASGPMTVLTSSAAAPVLADPACVDALRRLVAESAGIARALGCEVAPDVETVIDQLRNSSHVQSIVQDLLLGRPMEIAAIYDVPLELARLRGVPTPTLDLIVALARVRAAEAGLYRPA